jgi:hypothetical protein
MKNSPRWLVASALALLCAHGAYAEEPVPSGPINQFYVAQDASFANSASNLIVQGIDKAPGQTDDYLYRWVVTTPAGHNQTNLDVFADAIVYPAGTNGVQYTGDYPASWPDVVQQDRPGYSWIYSPDYWGTYFTYVPEENWYGVDTFSADGYNFSGSSFKGEFRVSVLNQQDKPVVEPVTVFIQKCAADADCNPTNGVSLIAVTDADYLTGPGSFTYEFTDTTNEFGQIANELGYATLTGNRLDFVITNTAYVFPDPSKPYIEIPVKVTDTIAFTNGLTDEAFLCADYGRVSRPGDPSYDTLPGYTPAAYADDFTIVTAKVWWAGQNGAYFTDDTATLPHGELTEDSTHPWGFIDRRITFYEGEAVTLTVTANDSKTNNPAQFDIGDCYGINRVFWQVIPWTSSYDDSQFTTGVVAEVTGPVDDDAANGVRSITSSYTIDTSSEAFTNGFRNRFVVRVGAVDHCGQTNFFRYLVTVRPTLEYPLIDMPQSQFPDQVLGATWTSTINELNGNNQFVDVSQTGPAGGLIISNNLDGTYTFTAIKTGIYTVRASVIDRHNGQVMYGYASQRFAVLLPASALENVGRTLVITGNDTNEFCYGQITFEPVSTDGAVEIDGQTYYRPDANVNFYAIASTTPEGADYTFLRWGLWNNGIRVNQNPTNEVPGSSFAGIGTNEVVTISDDLVAIFKKTSEIPAPLVNHPPELYAVTNWFNGDTSGPFADRFGVQSECLPWLEVRTTDGSPLPGNLVFTYQTISNYTGWTQNHSVFSNLRIDSDPDPEVDAEYTLELFVRNLAGKEVSLGTFTLVEVGPPTPPAWLDPEAVTATRTSTFNGWAIQDGRGPFENGQGEATMTVTVRPGKAAQITGKFRLDGKFHTFKATGYERDEDQSVFLIKTSYNVGTEVRRLTLVVAGDVVQSDDHRLDLYLYRNTFTGATPVNGYYTLALPSLDGVAGSGYITLTVGNKGVVKGSGRLGDGTTRSFSSALVEIPSKYDDEETGESTPAYAAVISGLPATYKGGYLFGIVEFYQDPDQGKTVIRLLKDGEPIEWVSNNEKASGVFGEGFARALDVSGGYYDKTASVQAYYNNALTVGNLPEVAELWFTYKNNGVSEDASAQAAFWNPGGLVLSGFTAPKATSPKKVKDGVYPDLYDYSGANDTGLKFSFTQATGLFRGTFNVYYDYVTAVNETTGKETTKHTAKKVSYQGAILRVRANVDDGIEGRGYFLMSDKATYEHPYTGKAVKYNFNWSYDFSLTR